MSNHALFDIFKDEWDSKEKWRLQLEKGRMSFKTKKAAEEFRDGLQAARAKVEGAMKLGPVWNRTPAEFEESGIQESQWFDVYYQKEWGAVDRYQKPTLDQVKGPGWIMVKRVGAADTEEVFHHMQGEVWSPRGEARPLIRALGLHHTSMSVGDALHDIVSDRWYWCAPCGFEEIKS
jgi:hypothetical protein